MCFQNKTVYQKKGTLAILPLLFLFFFFLTSCGGDGSAPKAGSEGTASVGISIKIGKTPRASVAKTLSAPEAPSTIKEVRVVVTGPSNVELGRSTATVSPGEPVVLTLNILAGPDRAFTVDAFDAEGRVRLFGREVTDLVAGNPVTLSITVSPPVTLTPDEAIVATRDTQVFTTTVHPGLNHVETQWFVNDELNGDSTVGTIISSGTNTAIYTAPDVLPETLAPIVVKGASDAGSDLYFDEAPVTLINKVRHVDPALGEDAEDCGAETAPCKTLTHVLSISDSGDMVLAAPGVFSFDSGGETAPLQLKPGVILRGQTLDGVPTVIDLIDPGESTSIATGILGADNATLSGFTIQGSPLFDRLFHTNGTAPRITNNTFKTTCAGDCPSVVAILADVSGGALIQGNTLGEDDFRGFSQAIQVSGKAAPRIIENTFVGNFTGIEIIEEAAPVLEGNFISDNGTGVSVLDTALPDLGREGGSAGQNILSCNTNEDLFVNTGTLIFAQNNQWDHVPPTIGTYSDEDIPGIDILLEIDSDVDDRGATQYPDGTCNIGLRVTPDSGLVTTEAGGSDTFLVTLGTQPDSDVEISLSSDTPEEGTVSPSRLLFDDSNWNKPQTVTVTGVNDTVADGPKNYAVLLTPASVDPDYNNLDPVRVSVTNEDNDFTTLRLPTAGTGSGTTSGAGTYDFNTIVAVRADPASGSTFTGWSGPDAAECRTGSVTMNRDKSCTATFEIDTRTLTLTKTGTGSGRIFSTPTGIDCGSGCSSASAAFPVGRTVTLTAEPAEDSDFTITDWLGCDGAGFTSCNVTMDADKTVMANFRSTAIFRAFFNDDDLNKPPNPALPGHPDGDRLSLRLNPDLDGTILVEEGSGDLEKKPLVLKVSGEGRFGFDGSVAGDPPASGIYVVRWRSLVTDTLINANVTVFVHNQEEVLAGLIYDEKGVHFVDQSVVEWQAGVSQLFEFGIDLDKNISSLKVDGKTIYEGVEICPPLTETTCDLADISVTMTTDRPSPQGFAMDNIEIFKVP